MSEGCDVSETLLAIARFDDERRDHELRMQTERKPEAGKGKKNGFSPKTSRKNEVLSSVQQLSRV